MNQDRYYELLAKEFPNKKAVASEIINLRAIRRLPKGTEYFFSDLHGEHLAFIHMLRSAAGNIKVKIDDLFDLSLDDDERNELANLIYYPERVMANLELRGEERNEWYRKCIYRLIEVSKDVSKKYTRSKVRKKIPEEYRYVIDELMSSDYTDFDKKKYYVEFINGVVEEGDPESFIEALCALISHLTVDQLHIVGDIFDRGPRPDLIIKELNKFADVDIQYGNHDVSWMGAACGNPALVCNTMRIALSYNCLDLLEDGYGIDIEPLMNFATKVYGDDPCKYFMPKTLDENVTDHTPVEIVAKMHKAIAVMQFKIEGQIIGRHPEYMMDDRKLMEAIDLKNKTLTVEGKEYPLRDASLPTLNEKKPFELTKGEEEILEGLVNGYKNSRMLQEQIRYIYAHGSVYKCANNNLLFHGSIPMTQDGEFNPFTIDGKEYAGRAYLDKVNEITKEAYFGKKGTKTNDDAVDFMWYLWCGKFSPAFGKHKIATLENYFVGDSALGKEHLDPYFKLSQTVPGMAEKVLAEFDMPETGHIINGHVPIKLKDGENPIKADGRVFVIDGGIAKSYQPKTGIAGYTLMYNSRHLALAEHTTSVKSDDRQILHENTPKLTIVEMEKNRLTVGDTDNGKKLLERIEDLKKLQEAYTEGRIKETY